jgi:hypothetical protein
VAGRGVREVRRTRRYTEPHTVPHFRRYQHSIHLRSDFCKGNIESLLEQLRENEGSIRNSTVFVATDRNQWRAALDDLLKVGGALLLPIIV